MSIAGSGRPIHVNGIAPVSTANAEKFFFLTEKDVKKRVKKFAFRIIGAVSVEISFDNGRKFFTVNPGELLWEEWELHYFHVKSTGAASAFQAIGTEV